MQGKVTVYFHFEQSSLVRKPKVLLSDVASVYVKDLKLKQEIERLELYRFFGEKGDKHAFCVMKVVELLAETHPEVAPEFMGEPDFVVEYEPEKSGKVTKLLDWIKAVFVCFAMFFGAAFTIVTFNKDASVEEIFPMIYRLTEGAERNGPGELEIAYSLGLPVGIILFFNHFGKKKFTVDPTPIEVEMSLYEKDIQTTLIAQSSRRGQELDVGKTSSNGSHWS